MSKHADDCNFDEMCERFSREVRKHGDERTIENYGAFRRKYAGMLTGETIGQFEKRLDAEREFHCQPSKGE